MERLVFDLGKWFQQWYSTYYSLWSVLFILTNTNVNVGNNSTQSSVNVKSVVSQIYSIINVNAMTHLA